MSEAQVIGEIIIASGPAMFLGILGAGLIEHDHPAVRWIGRGALVLVGLWVAATVGAIVCMLIRGPS